MSEPLTVTVRIPVRLMPEHRDDLLTTPISQLLEKVSPASRIAVQETVVSQYGEPLETVYQLAVHLPDAEKVVTMVLDLEKGLPKGSTVEINGKVATFGELEGVAVYLNGTELDAEVYEKADVAAIVADLQEALTPVGQIWSYFQGQAETALYFYGPEAAVIRGVIENKAPEHPLMERCRIVELIGPLDEQVKGG